MLGSQKKTHLNFEWVDKKEKWFIGDVKSERWRTKKVLSTYWWDVGY